MKISIIKKLVVLSTSAVLAIAGLCFVNWGLNRAFQPAVKEGGAVRQLADVLEASLGGTLARGDVRLQPREAKGDGALAYYQKNPDALQRDKKYFETWHSALAVADAARKSEHELGQWESSTIASWIAPSQRIDGWRHAFCVRSDEEQTIVLSPGPQAISSLQCKTLKFPAQQLARMPQGRLNPIDSGALVLFLKKAR